jgi:hypothetical protein
MAGISLDLCTDNLLCFLTPSWLLWIAGGLVLNATVQWKHLLPSIVSGMMEYGKLRLGESKSGLGYLLTVKVSNVQLLLILVLYHNALQVVYSFLRMGSDMELFPILRLHPKVHIPFQYSHSHHRYHYQYLNWRPATSRVH